MADYVSLFSKGQIRQWFRLCLFVLQRSGLVQRRLAVSHQNGCCRQLETKG